MQTSPQHGNLWSDMAQRQATPGGPWRMGGLGFGLPMSRLYARYFGARMSSASLRTLGQCMHPCICYLKACGRRDCGAGMGNVHAVPLRALSCLKRLIGHYSESMYTLQCWGRMGNVGATACHHHRHACDILPLVHAGGDLKLVSMDGYGVDAYLSIQHLEGVWQEQQVEAEVPEQETASEGAAHAVLSTPQLSHG